MEIILFYDSEKFFLFVEYMMMMMMVGYDRSLLLDNMMMNEDLIEKNVYPNP
jgi:hypothetical protein